MRALTAALTALLLLSACGTISRLGDSAGDSFRGSRLNPFSWFGRSTETRQVAAGAESDAELIAAAQSAAAAPVPRRSTLRTDIGDFRLLVDEVTEMQIDRLPGGAIVRATGLPRTQGYWDAGLIAAPLEQQGEDTLVFEFRLYPPINARAQGPAPAREVVVGRFVSDQTLQGVRQIVVIARQNRRAARR